MELIETTKRIAGLHVLIAVETLAIESTDAKETYSSEYIWNAINAAAWTQSVRIPLTTFVFDAKVFSTKLL